LQFNTPVLFLVFNRPDTTREVFSKIREAQPKHLFVAADGFRRDRIGEEEKCRQVREIATAVDWECELKTLFRSENLGCGKAVNEAITWFFKEVEHGIILEDDCLPDSCFFPYCQLQLDRYKNNEKIMHIAGVNLQNGIKRGEGSYYFSKYPHVWGWATWRRAWEHYDFKMSEWTEFRNSEQWAKWCLDKEEQDFWSHTFDLSFSGSIDTWDYQWFFAIIRNNGLCLMPNCNLISNIGFHAEATHTRETDTRFSKRQLFQYSFPDTLTAEIAHRDADEYSYRNVFSAPAPLAKKKISKKERLFRLVGKLKNKVKQLC
jgi:hypothetical protein